MPFVLPSALYPQKQFILPNIMSQQEVVKLFAAPLTLKEYCVIGLLYGSGLRVGEVAALCIQDIESVSKRIKVGTVDITAYRYRAKEPKTGKNHSKK